MDMIDRGKPAPLYHGIDGYGTNQASLEKCFGTRRLGCSVGRAPARSDLLQQHRNCAGTHGGRRFRAAVLLPDHQRVAADHAERRAVTWLVHAYATFFTAWMVLFIVQTALITQHKVAVHRRVGLAGPLLAVLMVATGAWRP
jgi:hypothetical protein